MRIETFLTFIVLIVVLIVLSYIGHLLWTGISWLFKLIFMGRQCPGCGRRLVGNESCLACENQRLELRQRPSVSEDLQAAERLRQYAGFQGWLDAEQNEYLKDCLTRLRYRVSGATPPPSASQASTVAPAPALPVPSAVANQSASSSIAPTASPPSTSQLIADAALTAELVTAKPVSSTGLDAIVAPPVQRVPSVTTKSEPHALEADYAPSDAPVSQAGVDSTGSKMRVPVSAPLQAQVLRSFMERSNIRWVELISASLVVVCSVGLVISLWSTLSRTSRFFPSLVFMFATLAVHGAGQYTLRRWKLRTTSRGILHIG